jgi:proline dehydrogenase
MRIVDRAIANFLPYLPKGLVGRVASRYIAGETVQDAIRVARDLNAKGFRATMDILGEDVHRLDQAQGAALTYRTLLDHLHREKIDSNVSVKLTQLGLKVDKTECLALADSIVTRAQELGNFVRLDMEDSSCTTDTLEIYTALRRRHANVGVVIQAYLHRTANDVDRLMRIQPNFRLCKGVYVEPETIAWHDMKDINRNYLQVLERLLRSGIYVGIATHDEKIVREAQRLIAALNLPPTAYEFQMLLGVTESLRARIRDAGHPLRVYIPFGRDWYAYSVRRLRENPRLAGYVLRAMLQGKSR